MAASKLFTASRCRCRSAANSLNNCGEGLCKCDRYWSPPGNAIQSLPGNDTPAVAVVGPAFAPDSFTGGVVGTGAALLAREGDLGFSPPNGEPEQGHEHFARVRPIEVDGLDQERLSGGMSDGGANFHGGPREVGEVFGF